MRVAATLLLLTYNSLRTVRDALAGALVQTYRPLQLIVGDDASTDGTGEMIEEIIGAYDGGIDVVVVRHESNLGLVGNILATLHGRSTGDIVVMAAGDDVSHPERVARIVDCWVKAGKPTPATIYSDLSPIDEAGELVCGWSERVARPPWTLDRLVELRDSPIGATCAYTPELFWRPRPLSSAVRHEDRILPFRTLLLGGTILWVDQPLVDYRVDGGMSRDYGATRIENVTEVLASRLRRMQPDANQQMIDLSAVLPGSAAHRLASRVATEMRFRRELAEGGAITPAVIRALRGGARVRPLARHLATVARAYAERYLGI